MKRKRLLDTYAILAWLQGEPCAGQVEEALEEGRSGTSELLVTLVNLGELYYTLRSRLTSIEVRNLLDQIIQTPVTIVPVDDDLVWEAAEIKAKNPLSCADCFAVAAAKRAGASIITGDPEFRRIEGFVPVEWLPPRV